MTNTVPALVLSAFEDATSGDRFAAGDTPTFSKGAFDNFEAAGLVRALEDDEIEKVAPLAAAAKPAPRKRSRAAK
ncbi:hypothetical protein [Sphingomonas sp. CARO-RG-8B-R24-01]|uniref:hypothetical protein n=1 Tax=Sphingomonas sp. CARO-RG-8B-R24-01 TaxID=2914831 RepID=UPI001F57BB78|nr:hypothetical protein [Sphingomonas sp. CARO-RG-8B-R24-01]